METSAGLVGIVVVSHSAKVAEGAAEMARQMAPEVTVIACGGAPDGSLGEDHEAIMNAIPAADAGAGVVVLVDLNGAVTAAKVALTLIDPDLAARTRISDGPIVEGTTVAAVQASLGSSLDEVAQAAHDTRNLPKHVE